MEIGTSNVMAWWGESAEREQEEMKMENGKKDIPTYAIEPPPSWGISTWIRPGISAGSADREEKEAWNWEKWRGRDHFMKNMLKSNLVLHQRAEDPPPLPRWLLSEEEPLFSPSQQFSEGRSRKRRLCRWQEICPLFPPLIPKIYVLVYSEKDEWFPWIQSLHPFLFLLSNKYRRRHKNESIRRKKGALFCFSWLQ